MKALLQFKKKQDGTLALKIFLQLFREFWMPLGIAILGTVVNFFVLPNTQKDISDVANSAFVTFFGVSFWFAQWNRVKKQLKVEAGLVDIEAKISAMLERLDEKTLDLAGLISGGDGFCVLDGFEHGLPTLRNEGKYPLFDITATLIDLDEVVRDANVANNQSYMGQSVYFSLIVNRTFVAWPTSIDLGASNARYFNVNFHARNGQFYQHLRFKRVKGEWLCALRVLRINPERVLFEFVHPDYPLNLDGVVDWDHPLNPA